MGTVRLPVLGSPGSSQSTSASTTSIAPQPSDGSRELQLLADEIRAQLA
jgi:hypothetical protein